MRSEKELNLIIKNSILYANGWAYKIPDPSGLDALTTIKRPFDGFGVFNGYPIYWESKFSKTFKSFNLNQLKDHQLHSLNEIKKLSKVKIYTYVFYAVQKNKDLILYYFSDIEDLINRKKEGKHFKISELLKLENKILFDKKLKIFDLNILTN